VLPPTAPLSEGYQQRGDRTGAARAAALPHHDEDPAVLVRVP
jgi:hypothetical protein